MRPDGIVAALLAFEMIVLPELSEVWIKMSNGVMVVTSPLLNVAAIGSEEPGGVV